MGTWSSEFTPSCDAFIPQLWTYTNYILYLHWPLESVVWRQLMGDSVSATKTQSFAWLDFPSKDKARVIESAAILDRLEAIEVKLGRLAATARQSQ